MIKQDFIAFRETAMRASNFQFLPVTLRHTALVASMPFHHKDPFDRLLAAQAIADGCELVTRDAAFAPYGVARLW